MGVLKGERGRHGEAGEEGRAAERRGGEGQKAGKKNRRRTELTAKQIPTVYCCTSHSTLFFFLTSFHLLYSAVRHASFKFKATPPGPDELSPDVLLAGTGVIPLPPLLPLMMCAHPPRVPTNAVHRVCL